MIDIAFLVYSVVLLALIGLPASLLLPEGRAPRIALAPVFGYCIVAILAPNLLRAGLAISQQVWLYGALAALGLGCLASRLRRGGELAGERRRDIWHLAAAWALAAAALSLPKWIAGEPYYAYHGNVWDYFNYVTAGSVFSKMSAAAIWASQYASPAAVLRNPMLIGLAHLHTRPSVTMAFAALAHVGIALKIPVFELANDFVSLTLSLYVPSLYFLLRAATDARPAARLVVPLTFACGFWGGYLIDVDAWSQLAGVMVMPALFGLGLEPLLPAAGTLTAGALDRLRASLALSLLVAGAIYLYPECLPVYVPVYGASLLAVLWASRSSFQRVIPQLAAAALGAGLALPCFDSTLGFLYEQIRSISSSPEMSLNWFSYFHGFAVVGDDLSALFRPIHTRLTITNGIAGLAGLYRVVPTFDSPHWLLVAVGIAVSVEVAALGWCALRSLRARELWLPAGLATGLALVAALALQGNPYAAGKAYVWLSPFLLLLLLLPLADPRATRWRRVPAQLYIGLQLVTMTVRLASVAAHDGIPGLSPYPGDPPLARRLETEFDLAPLLSRLDRCHMVRVDLEDPFLRHYVMVNLYARDVPYVSAQEINTYYGQGAALGFQTPAVRPDCTVRLGPAGGEGVGRNGFVVTSAGG